MRACLISFLLIITGASFAQEKTYKNLVFEGAGIRGIAYAGELKKLEQKGILPHVHKVGGTSAGAITALMVSLGYNADEIYKLIGQTQFGDFNDGRYFFIGGFRRLSKKYGWYRGEKFQQWLDEIIRTKATNGDITFKQLHDKGFKDLYVTGTSLNNQRLLIFSYQSYPNMRIKDAVRISMSVPLYFEAKYINSAGAIVDKPKDTTGLDLVVDGGITGNFPIWLFDEQKPDSLNHKIRIPNFQTLGVRIDSDEQIKADRAGRELVPLEINNLKSYISAFYIYILENLNRTELTNDDWRRTISVSSKNIGPKVKRLSDVEKQMLIKSGEGSVEEFLKTK